MDKEISLLEDMPYPIIFDLDPISLQVKYCWKKFPEKYNIPNEPHINEFKNKYTDEIDTYTYRQSVDKWKKDKIKASAEWRDYLSSLSFEDIGIQEEFNTIWHISDLKPKLEQYREIFNVPERAVWASSEYRKRSDSIVAFTKDIESNSDYELD
jgi:hypothetical protein